MTIWQLLLAWLIILVCALVILVVLIQRGRGGGLAGAFGGTGGSSAFGAKTGDVFTWITVVIVGVWGLLQVVANFAFDKSVIATPPPAVSTADGIPPASDAGDAGTEGAAPETVPMTPPANAPAGAGEDAGTPSGAAPSGTPSPGTATPEPAGDGNAEEAKTPGDSEKNGG